MGQPSGTKEDLAHEARELVERTAVVAEASSPSEDQVVSCSAKRAGAVAGLFICDGDTRDDVDYAVYFDVGHKWRGCRCGRVAARPLDFLPAQQKLRRMYVTNTLMGGEGASGQAAIRRGRVDGDIGIDGGLEDLRHCVGVREM